MEGGGARHLNTCQACNLPGKKRGLTQSLEHLLQTLLQSFYGVRIVLTGDNLISENALVVLNHPTRCSNQENSLHQNQDNLDTNKNSSKVVPEKTARCIFNLQLT